MTSPVRVFSVAANSAATGKPRVHTRVPPLVSTGQPSRSHRLTRLLLNNRFSLCSLRWPQGRNLSPGRQFRSISGECSASQSSTNPVSIVSPLFAGQSITLKRKTQLISGTLNSRSAPSTLITRSNSFGSLFFGQPFAERYCIEPIHFHDWMSWRLREIWRLTMS